ncbi:MAG: class I peptide chain release factor, partial [Gammaproteobacteria bacterium CG22_combo_CG10-13_8_21_14_all_40_8]
MLQINDNLSIPLSCIELNPMRSQGAGGQNVNKVSSAIHLRFDIKNSLLPEYIIQKL